MSGGRRAGKQAWQCVLSAVKLKQWEQRPCTRHTCTTQSSSARLRLAVSPRSIGVFFSALAASPGFPAAASAAPAAEGVFVEAPRAIAPADHPQGRQITLTSARSPMAVCLTNLPVLNSVDLLC